MKRTTLISPRKTAVFVHVAVVATGHVVGQIIQGVPKRYCL